MIEGISEVIARKAAVINKSCLSRSETDTPGQTSRRVYSLNKNNELIKQLPRG